MITDMPNLLPITDMINQLCIEALWDLGWPGTSIEIRGSAWCPSFRCTPWRFPRKPTLFVKPYISPPTVSTMTVSLVFGGLLSIALHVSLAFSLNPTPVLQSGYYRPHSPVRDWGLMRWYNLPNVKVRLSCRVKIQKVKIQKPVLHFLSIYVLFASYL